MAGLPRRAGSTLILLMTALMLAIVMLIPGQARAALGVELLAVGVSAGGILAWLNRPGTATSGEPNQSWLMVRFGPSVLSGAFTVTAGTTVQAGAGGGLYWIAPAVFLSLLAGISNAWVLLVEILR